MARKKVSKKKKITRKKHDPVNPSHYTDLKISPIKYIAANRQNFFEGNVIKYVSRHQKKNGLEDLKKAKWYLDFLIENYDDIYS